MSKIVIPFTAKLVKFETTVPFVEVTSRLDAEVNKSDSGNIMARLAAVKDEDQLESLVNSITKEKDFLFFMAVPQHRLSEILEGVKKPGIIVYTIGNPLLAQKILKQNPFAGYSIPPRLLVHEKPDGSGTVVSYHLPSSVMGVPDGYNDPALQTVIDLLDEKVEGLVERITAT